MTDEALAEALVPIAAELVGCVRDYGKAEVNAVLARVPEGRHDALAVVLAAMVDPDARPQQLLAWTRMGPVTSRPEFTPRPQVMCPECDSLMAASSLSRHMARSHSEAA